LRAFKLQGTKSSEKRAFTDFFVMSFIICCHHCRCIIKKSRILAVDTPFTRSTDSHYPWAREYIYLPSSVQIWQQGIHQRHDVLFADGLLQVGQVTPGDSSIIRLRVSFTRANLLSDLDISRMCSAAGEHKLTHHGYLGEVTPLLPCRRTI
jgi:hypothetical protein